MRTVIHEPATVAGDRLLCRHSDRKEANEDELNPETSVSRTTLSALLFSCFQALNSTTYPISGRLVMHMPSYPGTVMRLVPSCVWHALVMHTASYPGYVGHAHAILSRYRHASGMRWSCTRHPIPGTLVTHMPSCPGTVMRLVPSCVWYRRASRYRHESCMRWSCVWHHKARHYSFTALPIYNPVTLH